MTFTAIRTASTNTALTCNCLLPAPWCTTPPSAPAQDPSQISCTFYAASYELLQKPATSANAEISDGEDEVEADVAPCHVGECATYRTVSTRNDSPNSRTNSSDNGRGDMHDGTTLQQLQSTNSAKTGAPSMPGVFDLVSVPHAFLASLHPSHADSHYVMVACTDGSVRLLNTSSLTDVVTPFTDIHEEMITSCTPLFLPGQTRSASSGSSAPHLLCSAHTGAVVLYSLLDRRVTQQLEGHEFDAWCTAAIPMGGWWTAPAPRGPTRSHEDDDADNGSSSDDDDGIDSRDGAGNSRDTGAAADTPVSDALLASGGDDGFCKLYDVRSNCSKATSRMRFDAGVVSVTPVLETSLDASTACSTPYVLVGSYDESIALIDVRSMRRPVARREGLGGGVWRTSRCLRPLWTTKSSTKYDRHGDSDTLATVTAAANAENADAETATAASTSTNANLRLMIENAMSPSKQRGEGGSAAAPCTPLPGWSSSCGWVNTANVLVLPLMQRGAALLPYDVRASADDVFGSAPLTYLYAEDGDDAASVAGSALEGRVVLNEKSLIYDTAVLRPLRGSGEDASSSAVVATASFYERRIDLWQVREA